MIKELLFFTCVITICSSAAITNIESELEPKVLENGIEENSDLETAEGKHFGPRVVVIKKGYGHGGYNGGRGCGCGHGGSHYHSHHRYYGKKK